MIATFIRHGSTLWNDEGRMQGRRDIPLSLRGRAQVRAWRIPREPEGPAAWLTSPLCRAVETAEMLCGAEVPREPALIEMDWGEWEGSSLEELRKQPGARYAENEARGIDFRPPGGESPRDVLMRLQPWLQSLATRSAPVIAVTHLGVLRAMLSAATGWDMTGKPPVRLLDNTLHRFAVDERGRISVVRCNLPLATTPDALPP
jgi:2,3-bisphosphoglycerate-dependent phosphoglycerate mutase